MVERLDLDIEAFKEAAALLEEHPGATISPTHVIVSPEGRKALAMKRIQWVSVKAWIDEETGLIKVGVYNTRPHQTIVLDQQYLDEKQACIRVGIVVEPSLKVAMRDFRDAVQEEIVKPLVKWLDRLVPR